MVVMIVEMNQSTSSSKRKASFLVEKVDVIDLVDVSRTHDPVSHIRWRVNCEKKSIYISFAIVLFISSF